jgi:hypothetical protein
MNVFFETLQIMGNGMLGVFISILVVYGMISILNKIF